MGTVFRLRRPEQAENDRYVTFNNRKASFSICITPYIVQLYKDRQEQPEEAQLFRTMEWLCENRTTFLILDALLRRGLSNENVGRTTQPLIHEPRRAIYYRRVVDRTINLTLYVGNCLEQNRQLRKWPLAIKVEIQEALCS